jgi:hypothetical protein
MQASGRIGTDSAHGKYIGKSSSKEQALKALPQGLQARFAKQKKRN